MENRTIISVALLVLRLALGATMLAHGLLKVGVPLAPSAAANIQDQIARFGSMGIPAWLGYLSIAAELLGGLGLIIGFLGRLAAFGVAVNMVVAIAKVHWKNGFFAENMGFEWQMSLVAMAFALMLTGMGAYSVDGWLAQRMDKTITSKQPTS